MVDYGVSGAGISFNLTTGVHTGIAAGDTFANIEFIAGSAYADTFFGNSSGNQFIGGTGADSFDGQGGGDLVAYFTSAWGVTVNLTTGLGSGGDAGGDTYLSIESIHGSSFDDLIVGDAGQKFIYGGWGSDILDGGDGNDTIYGNGAVAGLSATPGTTVQNDEIYGGGGDDTIYSLDGGSRLLQAAWKASFNRASRPFRFRNGAMLTKPAAHSRFSWRPIARFH